VECSCWKSRSRDEQPDAKLHERIDAKCWRWVAGAVKMKILCVFGRHNYGNPARGPKAARRMLYETNWRLVGAVTYSATGWPGRVFDLES
jgi:hypothetical protein